ncbi:hypothetical protein GCM10025783_11950 [Amnibacterium soli]|uniref:Uncharacterized protein n=2 Tax=Amnibacterium soli TaxID=1282736 RepID=A0ABP8YZT2_9MICO
MQTPATKVEDLGPLLGGLVFRLRQSHVAGTPWPTLIAPDSAHRVSDLSGVLQVLPADVDMQYLASSDATAYRIRLFLVADPTKYVDYDSNIDEITKSPSF